MRVPCSVVPPARIQVAEVSLEDQSLPMWYFFYLPEGLVCIFFLITPDSHNYVAHVGLS